MEVTASGQAKKALAVIQTLEVKKMAEGMDVESPKPLDDSSTSTETKEDKSGGGCANLLKIIVVVVAVVVSIVQPQLAPVAIAAASAVLQQTSQQAGSQSSGGGPYAADIKTETDEKTEKLLRELKKQEAIDMQEVNKEIMRWTSKYASVPVSQSVPTLPAAVAAGDGRDDSFQETVASILRSQRGDGSIDDVSEPLGNIGLSALQSRRLEV